MTYLTQIEAENADDLTIELRHKNIPAVKVLLDRLAESDESVFDQNYEIEQLTDGKDFVATVLHPFVPDSVSFEADFEEFKDAVRYVTNYVFFSLFHNPKFIKDNPLFDSAVKIFEILECDGPDPADEIEIIDLIDDFKKPPVDDFADLI